MIKGKYTIRYEGNYIPGDMRNAKAGKKNHWQAFAPHWKRIRAGGETDGKGQKRFRTYEAACAAAKEHHLRMLRWRGYSQMLMNPPILNATDRAALAEWLQGLESRCWQRFQGYQMTVTTYLAMDVWLRDDARQQGWPIWDYLRVAVKEWVRVDTNTNVTLLVPHEEYATWACLK